MPAVRKAPGKVRSRLWTKAPRSSSDLCLRRRCLPPRRPRAAAASAASTGKRSFAALLPDNACANVVEIAFKQAVARRGGRVAVFEKYGSDRATPARNVAQALAQADALLLADDGESVVAAADALSAAGANLRNIQLLGTGLWDNPRVFASASLQGGLYAAPDPAGFHAFAGRYRTRYGARAVRAGTL